MVPDNTGLTDSVLKMLYNEFIPLMQKRYVLFV